MKNISLLTPVDLPLAFQIEQASHAFPWSDKTFYSNQGERYLNYKITLNDRIVGFAITQYVMDEATLFNIAIHPEHQSRGYGRELLTHLINILPEKQINTLWLEVRRSNQSAIRLYEDMGFNEVSIRKNYYPTAAGKEDAIIMALPLFGGDW
ncbi:ribosomal protein S18-alanine N-acetyltransferase [Xenorhabdus nematophila]|uniref:ribosomal protein S18-alanine N-acetyltransferase n=1 Tax=Xenorhabdus nematophila TaxID=628 RepID=UPI000541AA32|nr:ribosomal protein S18-alanine N-acetyltransferase [Xenorhabdus nematophila]CEF28651.1 modification of 30S ribosomal subunit protein S18; acetylation of N-terminal alanine [Xenorhabdus nematophila str. Websteri]AYA39336.1 ribosomal-protein-alanine N-acetyltransferase RimI [Xenorhabdus nematophila]KHD27360.1 alanine acetyltransferase [Xenorhabdus nematophila]MBA0017915.1 ribosomal protein S18-alanine N-acetyltransferase [Xenorhabdus nematophila]MCB4426415.1 ribosomal protein S18-alanine N-ace